MLKMNLNSERRKLLKTTKTGRNSVKDRPEEFKIPLKNLALSNKQKDVSVDRIIDQLIPALTEAATAVENQHVRK